MDIDRIASPASEWLHRLNLPTPSGRLCEVLEVGAEAMRAGCVDVAGLCEAAAIDGGFYRRHFGGSDEFLVAIAGFLVAEALRAAVDDFFDGVGEVRTTGEVAEIISAWLQQHISESTSGSHQSFATACGVLWEHGGVDILAKAVEVQSMRMSFQLREWQGRWMARFDSDEITRAFLFVAFVSSSWLFSPQGLSSSLPSLLRKIAVDTALDGPTRMLRSDSWHPDLRTSALEVFAPDFGWAAAQLGASRPDRANEIVSQVAEMWWNDPTREMGISDICDLFSVSRRTLYASFGSLEFLVFSSQAVFTLATVAAYVERLERARPVASPEEAERLLSDFIQSFAEPNSSHYRRLRISAISRRDVLDPEGTLESEFRKLVRRLSTVLRNWQSRNLISQEHHPDAVAYLFLLHTVSRAIADSTPHQLPDAAWGWEIDILFGGILATSDDSIFRTSGEVKLVE